MKKVKYLICNFKENKTLVETLKYVEDFRFLPKTTNEIIMAPPLPYFLLFNKSHCKLASQDVSIYEGGAHTGEVSAKQLKSMNATYSLVGHSERRILHNENETILTKKIRNCFNAGLKVIYCIGETKEEKERNKTMVVLERQIGIVLNNFTHSELENIIIAYEPVWAIGTGTKATNSTIYEVISFIKKLINDYYEIDIPVLYGGSINRDNIKELEEITNLDGYLVGNACLDINHLKDIILEIEK